MLLLLASCCAPAQDTLEVDSPDGHLAFRLGVGLPPAPGAFLRVRYTLVDSGGPLLQDSWMGFWIHDQEPMLGEKVGLTDSKKGKGEGYNWLVGDFLQDGSLGRELNVEVRVYNDKVAFRYIIPRTSPLENLYIDNEVTEFSFAGEPRLPDRTDLPADIELPGGKWVEIAEAAAKGLGRALLVKEDSRTLVTQTVTGKESPAIETKTPLVSSWRIIAIGTSKGQLAASMRELDLTH